MPRLVSTNSLDCTVFIGKEEDTFEVCPFVLKGINDEIKQADVMIWVISFSILTLNYC